MLSNLLYLMTSSDAIIDEHNCIVVDEDIEKEITLRRYSSGKKETEVSYNGEYTFSFYPFNEARYVLRSESIATKMYNPSIVVSEFNGNREVKLIMYSSSVSPLRMISIVKRINNNHYQWKLENSIVDIFRVDINDKINIEDVDGIVTIVYRGIRINCNEEVKSLSIIPKKLIYALRTPLAYYSFNNELRKKTMIEKLITHLSIQLKND